LRLFASSGFGSVNKNVDIFIFPAVRRASAIVGISLLNAFQLLIVTSLHDEYHWELTATRVILFTCQTLQPDFQQFSGFRRVLLPIHIFNPYALNTLRCACSSIPCGLSVQELLAL
jgi:hypothetical protein